MEMGRIHGGFPVAFTAGGPMSKNAAMTTSPGTRLAMRILIGSVLWCLQGAIAGGCSEPTGPRTVNSEELTVRIPAIKRAVAEKDESSTADLVRQLDDDDPAVRLYAIAGLRRLTGQDLGYHYYDDKEARRPAVERWNDWLSEQKN
jgi:hypothetical protein